MNGTVKFFNESKGFGFIAADDGKEYFVHQTGLAEGTALNENDAVSFDVTEGDRGPKAVNVSLAGAEAPEEASEEGAEEAPAEEASEEAPEEASEEGAEEAPAEEAAEEAAEEPAEEPAEEEATEEKDAA